MANKIEYKIRDWLADNLSFIEADLKLIEKEYHLPDTIGSRGYVDILAKDVDNNFVIIEVKRSNSSARETATELLKYHSLVRDRFRARDYEIRLIIISTHWSEIVRPFSELAAAKFTIKGFQITIDPDSSIPIDIVEKKPLSDDKLVRNFSKNQILSLFKTREKRNKYEVVLREKLSSLGIEDFATIFINTDNTSANFKYGAVTVYQEIDEHIIISIIEKIQKEPYYSNISPFQKKMYRKHLEIDFVSALKLSSLYDDFEFGSVEKFDVLITEAGWHIEKIFRYGFLNIDPRYDDEQLILEARGIDGNSNSKFSAIADSSQIKKVEHLLASALYCLEHAPNWKKNLAEITEIILAIVEPYRISINIFNPISTVKAFYYRTKFHNKACLPYYQLIVSYKNREAYDIYAGILVWNGKATRENILPLANDHATFFEFNNMINGNDNNMWAEKMQLVFSNSKTTVSGGKIKSTYFIVAQNGIINKDPNAPYHDLDDYGLYNEKLVNALMSKFSTSYLDI